MRECVCIIGLYRMCATLILLSWASVSFVFFDCIWDYIHVHHVLYHTCTCGGI